MRNTVRMAVEGNELYRAFKTGNRHKFVLLDRRRTVSERLLPRFQSRCLGREGRAIPLGMCLLLHKYGGLNLPGIYP